MKKVFVLICCVMLLCGCSKSGAVEPKLSGISFTAQTKYFNEQYECRGQSLDNNDIEIEVVSPQHLEGMKLHYTDGAVKAQYKGIEFEPNIESMPSVSVAKAVFGVLVESQGEKATQNQRDENYNITGKIDNICYTLYLSPAGLPLWAEIPDENYTVTFKNVTIK